MRARYTAYVLGDVAFLRASWHPSTRPAHIEPGEGPAWLRLEVCATTVGHVDDDAGTVEFKAHYRDGARLGILHEVSRFVREDGHWYYLDGELRSAATHKAGRNAPCPCGSGRKFKRCCGA